MYYFMQRKKSQFDQNTKKTSYYIVKLEVVFSLLNLEFTRNTPKCEKMLQG